MNNRYLYRVSSIVMITLLAGCVKEPLEYGESTDIKELQEVEEQLNQQGEAAAESADSMIEEGKRITEEVMNTESIQDFADNTKEAASSIEGFLNELSRWTGNETDQPADIPSDQVPVELQHIYDGDTISVLLSDESGQTEEVSVRYLLIDTPESNHPDISEPQPFAIAAKERNAELLEGATITLEFDEGEPFDQYGRALAYVYADGERVQDILVREGLARVAYVYLPSTRYAHELYEIEEQAQKDNIGIWSIDDYVQEDGFFY